LVSANAEDGMLAKSATADIAPQYQIFPAHRNGAAENAGHVASDPDFRAILFGNEIRPGFSRVAGAGETNFTSVFLWSNRKHHLRGEEI